MSTKNQILRPHQVANSGVKSSTINRLGKSVVNSVMSLGSAIFGTSIQETTLERGFIADAFSPSADGTSNTVTLTRGMAFLRDSTADDEEWSGEIRPMFSDAPLLVNMPINNDVSGHPRRDVIAIRPVVESFDSEQVKVKLSEESPITTETQLVSRAFGLEIQIFTGVASASPTTPSVGAGWLKICDVERQNNVSNVAATDITDRRNLNQAPIRANVAEIFSEVILGRWGGDFTRIQRAAELDNYHQEGDILFVTESNDDTKADGRIHVGDMTHHGLHKSFGQSILASCLFSVQSGTISNGDDFTIVSSNGIENVTYVGGTEKLISIGFFNDERKPRSNRYLCLIFPGCDPNSGTPLGHFMCSPSDATQAYAQYVNTSGNLDIPPSLSTSAGGLYQVFVIDLTPVSL